LRDIGDTIHLHGVPELQSITRHAHALEIGAAVSLQAAFEAIVPIWPQWQELARRFASRPVKNAGTLGGNVANGSPIGDSMPALIAMGTRLRLRLGDEERDIALKISILPTSARRCAPANLCGRCIFPCRRLASCFAPINLPSASSRIFLPSARRFIYRPIARA